MVGLAMREANECERCGHDLDEVLNFGIAWVADEPVTCFYCEARQRAVKADEKHPSFGARLYRMHKVERRGPATGKSSSRRRSRRSYTVTDPQTDQPDPDTEAQPQPADGGEAA